MNNYLIGALVVLSFSILRILYIFYDGKSNERDAGINDNE